MCCFSSTGPSRWFRRAPLQVSATEIFARRDGADQLLAYSLRLSTAVDVWSALPHYRDYGFAVFKLRAGGDQVIHPMAFRFPSREPARLFFPTVHVHDGRVHPQAQFDHTLYFQDRPDGQLASVSTGMFVDLDRTQGLVTDALLHKTVLCGGLPNQDTWI